MSKIEEMYRKALLEGLDDIEDEGIEIPEGPSELDPDSLEARSKRKAAADREEKAAAFHNKSFDQIFSNEASIKKAKEYFDKAFEQEYSDEVDSLIELLQSGEDPALAQELRNELGKEKFLMMLDEFDSNGPGKQYADTLILHYTKRQITSVWHRYKNALKTSPNLGDVGSFASAAAEKITDNSPENKGNPVRAWDPSVSDDFSKIGNISTPEIKNDADLSNAEKHMWYKLGHYVMRYLESMVRQNLPKKNVPKDVSLNKANAETGDELGDTLGTEDASYANTEDEDVFKRWFENGLYAHKFDNKVAFRDFILSMVLFSDAAWSENVQTFLNRIKTRLLPIMKIDLSDLQDKSTKGIVEFMMTHNFPDEFGGGPMFKDPDGGRVLLSQRSKILRQDLAKQFALDQESEF